MIVLLHPRAAKALEKPDKTVKEEIKDKLTKLEGNYKLGKSLSCSGFWSLRIGDYRAIYEVDRVGNKVIVFFIGHRKQVYGDFRRLT